MLRPCRHRLPGDLATAWTAHLCGLCLALRDRHGHASRLVTNTDAVAISALVEAQTGLDDDRRRVAGPCALRGMRRAPVARGDAAALAATVSLTLAAAKLEDHVADGDTSRRLVVAGTRVAARRAARAAADDGVALGFASSSVLEAVRRQAGLERSATAGTALLALTAPTEEATAAACAHTAVLGGRPENVGPLSEVGRFFGRLAHLLDAVEDLAADRAAGRFNPVEVAGTPLPEVRRHCDDAVLGIRLALQEATFADRRLVHRLLVHETEHAVARAFGDHATGHGPAAYPPPEGPAVPLPPPGTPVPSPPPPPAGGIGGGLLAGCLSAIGLCCTGQMCCADEYHGPFSGRKREGCLRRCDCSDCCDCGGCCGDACGCDCC